MPGKETMSMITYVIDILKSFPEQIVETAVIPTAECLFNVKSPKQLPDEQAIMFHYVVAKLL